MSGSETEIKKIPYGVSDYDKIVTGNYYYVDKTPYLKIVEEAGDYLFFIRPRRFGKSLFLSMMEGYYDVYYKDRFQELFKDRAILDSPTKEQGTYLVLGFNFSMVDPAPDKVEDSFLNHVKNQVLSFIYRYDKYLSDKREHYIKTIKDSRSAADIVSALSGLCRFSNQKIYALIDEYDNFANTILSTVGEEAYYDLTHGKGFFRSFFNMLKGGTGGMGAPFNRLFMTGVSPITLDDVTSGYNIGKNVSIDPLFNQMLGFTESDVLQMIEYYREKGRIKHDNRYLLPVIRQWYNNYIFSPDSQTPLFNSDMILYFLDEYFKVSTIPRDLIDRNVRIDYGKLRHLIVVDKKGRKEPNGNFSRLREIIEEGEIASKITKGFPLEEMDTEENFTSLLFYFGLLSIMGEKEGLPLLKIPPDGKDVVLRLYHPGQPGYRLIGCEYWETGYFTAWDGVSWELASFFRLFLQTHERFYLYPGLFQSRESHPGFFTGLPGHQRLFYRTFGKRAQQRLCRYCHGALSRQV